MYTKARIAGHPIHPALIAFPVALYTSTVVALIVHAATGDPFWFRAAMWTNIGGVVMAAVAAIPGFIDLISLPRHSRALKTGLRHAGFNVFALVLFIISGVLLINRYYGSVAGTANLTWVAPLVLSAIGLCSTVVAGTLGWALVQTHHVGVRPTEYGVARAPGQVDDLDELAATPPTIIVEQRTEERVLRH
jgi:uncharacterized membrane protein